MFRTIVNIPESKLKIGFESDLLAMGSCFAENIGTKFSNNYFNISVNPFGVLFNPASISKNLRRLISGNLFTDNDLFEHNGIWNSFAHSSLFSKVNKTETLEFINSEFLNAHRILKNTDYLILTFGTAWVYEIAEKHEIVSNCHKLSASNFNRRRLSVDEIVHDYQHLICELTAFNPKINIIFTVSPVRHFKDGAHENNLSKSTLLLAFDHLQNQFSTVDYFPAYEIQMDELRDYRFYADDMCHPSGIAVDYIWKKFTETYFKKETLFILKEIESYNQRKNHILLHPETNESIQFQNKTNELKLQLISKYPFLTDRI